MDESTRYDVSRILYPTRDGSGVVDDPGDPTEYDDEEAKVFYLGWQRLYERSRERARGCTNALR